MCLRWSSLVERAAASSISSFSFSRCVSLSIKTKRELSMDSNHLYPAFGGFHSRGEGKIVLEFPQERECKSSAKGWVGGVHGFQGRGELVTLKNKHGTFK